MSDLTWGLVAVVSLILILIGVLNYAFTANLLESNLRSQAESSAAKMANILSNPLWTLDLPTIRKIGESFTQSDNVISVDIIDETGRVLFSSPNDEVNMITARHPVEYDQRTIGSVKVSLSSRGIRDAQVVLFITTLVTVLLVTTAIQIAMRLLLQHFLAQPLHNLIEGIDSIAHGSYDHQLQPVPQADINVIIQGANSMARQIQERVESLRQSEERFRQVVISISDLIYLTEVTPANEVINHYVSPHAEDLTGYPAEQCETDWSFWIEHVIHPDDRLAAAQQWDELRHADRSETEYRLIRKDQQIIWVRDSARMVKSGDSRMVYGVISDITSRKQVEADLRAESAERALVEQELRKYQGRLEELVRERTTELEEVNKELESFAYTISHDLRAPLRHMDGYSQVILEDYSQDLTAEGLQLIKRIRFGVQRMSDLIDGLLKFSRLSRHPLSLQPVETDVMVQQVLDNLAAERNNRKIEFTVANLPACQADALLLEQVFTNLIHNAIKYTAKCEVAYVEIGTIQMNGQPVYFIRDNGIGIDMKYADKLFGVFQRLHSSTEYEGTGVGLAIVQRIIHRHGGRIWAESTLGQGSTFYFSLPAAAQSN